MLYRYRFLILILAFLLLTPVYGYSTKGDPKEENPKKGEKAEKKTDVIEDTLDIYEAENKTNDRVEIPKFTRKDNPATNRNTKAVPSSYSSNDEDEADIEDDSSSAMSFNIIYYIIDKFKFTDPLE